MGDKTVRTAGERNVTTFSSQLPQSRSIYPGAHRRMGRKEDRTRLGRRHAMSRCAHERLQLVLVSTRAQCCQVKQIVIRILSVGSDWTIH